MQFYLLNEFSGYQKFYWFFDNETDSVQVNKVVESEAYAYQEVVLKVINSYGCVDEKSEVLATRVDKLLHVPNAFSPNSDGFNDVFQIVGEYLDNTILYVYNAWGELIHVSQKGVLTWDGKCQNEVCQTGTYLYDLVMPGKKFRGTLQLIK